MTDVRDLVAEEVRALLARRRLSMRAAAEQLGWTPMYLSRRMTGAAPFNVDDLASLAVVLDVDVTVFFAGVDPTSLKLAKRPISEAVNAIYRWPVAA